MGLPFFPERSGIQTSYRYPIIQSNTINSPVIFIITKKMKRFRLMYPVYMFKITEFSLK